MVPEITATQKELDYFFAARRRGHEASDATIAVSTVFRGFDIQTRLVGHSALYRMVLTH